MSGADDDLKDSNNTRKLEKTSSEVLAAVGKLKPTAHCWQ